MTRVWQYDPSDEEGGQRVRDGGERSQRSGERKDRDQQDRMGDDPGLVRRRASGGSRGSSGARQQFNAR